MQRLEIGATDTAKRRVLGEFGEAEIVIPRDRNGAFEPVIVQKGQTRFDGFDGKILSLYARGMSVRDIQAQLQDLYGVEVSAGLISARYGCSRGGTQALAKPGTRPGLSDCLLRCHCGQSPARRARG